MDHPERGTPAHQPLHGFGNRAHIVFVTVCTKDRKNILASDAIHRHLVDIWSGSKQWLVGKYVILPDHIHLFCAPAQYEAENVRDWVKYWKAVSALHWPIEIDKPIWQSQAWDTQLRKGDSYSEKWRYVQNNPVRHRLVDNARDWPYQGELNKLQWHD